MNRFALTLSALAPLLLNTGCATPSATAVSHTQDEAELRQFVATQAKAWNDGDAKTWSAEFAADADFVNIVGTLFQGHDEIERRHAGIFGTIFKGSQDKVTVRRIVFPEPELAIVDTIHEVTGHPGLPPGVQNTEPGLLRTQMQYVMKKTQGQWHIIAGHNVDVKPAPAH